MGTALYKYLYSESCLLQSEVENYCRRYLFQAYYACIPLDACLTGFFPKCTVSRGFRANEVCWRMPEAPTTTLSSFIACGIITPQALLSKEVVVRREREREGEGNGIHTPARTKCAREAAAEGALLKVCERKIYQTHLPEVAFWR